MKINLIMDGMQVLPNYLNLSPVVDGLDPYLANHSQCIKGNTHSLDQWVDDGEAEQIRAVNVLEYYKFEEVPAVLANWCKKVAHNGTFTLICYDAHEVCRLFHLGHITFEQLNEYIYKNKNSLLTLPIVSQLIATYGLTPKTKKYTGPQFILEAVRP